MAEFAISAEFVRPGRVGGIEQALHYTVDGLGKSLGAEDRVTVVASAELGLDGGPRVFAEAVPSGFGPRFLTESRDFWRFAAQHDAYFFPNYFTPPLPKRGCRVVTTIPDLQYRHLPMNFSRRKRIWLRAAHAWTLRHADAITTYSSYVRNDLISTYGAGIADKVHVLPIPVTWDRFGQSADTSERDQYVLAVASHYAHKNLETLIRAFSLIRRTHQGARLIIAGQIGVNLIGVRQVFDAQRLIDELGLGHTVEVTGYIDVLKLGDLYRGASALVFPSLFEGFGLPPVEALGFGTHVITTRCTSLPEVTLGLSEYVDDPRDPDELAARIRRQFDWPSAPAPEDVQRVRDHYAPARIGAELHRLLLPV